MILTRLCTKLFRHEATFQFCLIVFMILYYGTILIGRDFDLFRPAGHIGLTFNTMLEHLLHGRFDVDPQVIGFEGFLRDGRVYSYWGAFCAFIRLPLIAFKGGLATDVTRLSCLAGVCLAGTMKLRTALFMRRYCQLTPISEWAFFLLVVYIVFGGAAVGYLRPSIYQEIVYWAAAFGAAFVYYAVKGIVQASFTVGRLGLMALFAGLALLDRVSTGMGLFAALGLLLVWLVLVENTATDDFRLRRGQAARILTAITSRRILIPGAILLGFAILTGTINFFRWGNPLTFADFSLYLYNQGYVDRIGRTQTYGLFNLARIPFSLGYYFVPIWVLQGSDGQLLFEETRNRLFDSAELPPSSFFLTDLLPFVFIAFLAVSFRRAQPFRPIAWGQLLALALGLAVPGVLMLTAISLNYRYRMEFYPEIDLLGFIGLYTATSSGGALAIPPARYCRCGLWLAFATLVSVLLAHGALLLLKMSDFGPVQEHLQDRTIWQYYWNAWSVAHGATVSH